MGTLQHVLVNYMFNGLDHLDEILLLNRFVVGMFFAISGHHKLFIPQRHAQLVATLEACGIPHVWFCQWFVPLVEFFGGLAVLTGILAPLAALGMLMILLVAIFTDGPRRIREYQPIDRADWFDDLLYLPETTYAVMLIIVIIEGPGRHSFHWWVMSYLGLS